MRLSYVLFAAAFFQLANGQEPNGITMNSTASALPVPATRVLRESTGIENDSEERMITFFRPKSYLLGKGPFEKLPDGLFSKIDARNSAEDNSWVSTEDLNDWKRVLEGQSFNHPYRLMTRALMKKVGDAQFLKIIGSTYDESGYLHVFRNELLEIWSSGGLSVDVVFKELMTKIIRIDDNVLFHTFLLQLWFDYATKRNNNAVSINLSKCDKNTLLKVQAAVEQTSLKIPNEKSRMILHFIRNELIARFHHDKLYDAQSTRFKELYLQEKFQPISLMRSQLFFNWMTYLREIGLLSYQLISIIVRSCAIEDLEIAMAQRWVESGPDLRNLIDKLQISIINYWKFDGLNAELVFLQFDFKLAVPKELFYNNYWMKAWIKYVSMIKNESAGTYIYIFLKDRNYQDKDILDLLDVTALSPLVVADVWTHINSFWKYKGMEGAEVYKSLRLPVNVTPNEVRNMPMFPVWETFMMKKYPSNYDDEINDLLQKAEAYGHRRSQ